MSDLLARLVSLADCDGRAGEPLGKAMREAAAEIVRLNKHIAIMHDVADQRDQIILERIEQYKDALEHAKIWRERAERAEALLNGEQNKPETFRESATSGEISPSAEKTSIPKQGL
jgi:arginine deiminase